jgi:hypothetical protein
MPAPELDAGSLTTAIQTGGTSGTIFLTTNAANEVVFLFVQVGTTGATITTSVSGAGLTWTKRKSVVNTNVAYSLTELWYAPAPSIVAGSEIAVTTSGTMDDMALIIAAVTGCAPQIFDTNASLPAGPETSSTSPIPITISTSETNDVVFGVIGTNASNGSLLVDTAAGFSLLTSVTNAGGTHFARMGVEYNVYATPQSGLAFNFGDTGTVADDVLFADAITSSAPSAQTATCFFGV